MLFGKPVTFTALWEAVKGYVDSQLGGEVPSTRSIATTAPLAGGGDLSADRTLSIAAASGSAAGSMSAANFSKLAALPASMAIPGAIGGTTPAAIDGTTITASTRVLAPQGSTGTPGYGFTGQGNTGLYSSGANEAAIVTGGTQAVKFDASQVATFAGNVVAPAVKITTALVSSTGGGGNAALTAASTGGTGQPTLAAQAGWVKLLDSTGATIWLPVWQ